MLLKRLVMVAPIRFGGSVSNNELISEGERELDFSPKDEVVYLREKGEVRLIVPRDAVLCMEPLSEKK